MIGLIMLIVLGILLLSAVLIGVFLFNSDDRTPEEIARDDDEEFYHFNPHLRTKQKDNENQYN
jgi:hypothetical protein